MTAPEFFAGVSMTRAEIAAALKQPPRWLYKNLPKLYAAGMPQPFFGQGSAARWSRKAFMAWLNGEQPPTIAIELPPADPAIDEAARDRRARRAQAIGAGEL